MGRRPPQAAPDPVETLLKEAEALQQRAERRQSEPAAALTAYEAAAASFERAAQLCGRAGSGAPAAEAPQRAEFGLGESLQGWANMLMAAAASLPAEQHGQEVAAAHRAGSLLERAVRAFEQVREPGGIVRADAAVATGNALCSAAELATSSKAAGKLLAAACDAYEAALRAEADAMTHSNLADALVARAERLCDGGGAGDGLQLYRRAMEQYEAACALSSSEQADDLPGLLHNWGVGLHSLGTHSADAGQAEAALEQAAQRLRDSGAFNRGDPAPLNALGDVRMAQAEAAAASNSAAAATAAQASLDQGYSAALAIHAANADALVGTAEAHAFLGGLAAPAAGDAATSSRQHFAAATDAYAAALALPQPLGLFSERCDIRYNFACAAAQCGRQQEAAHALQHLLALGHTSAAELAADRDFTALRGEPWFQQLLGAASSANTG